MTDHIEITTDGAVQLIRMNRPEKKNALMADMYRAMTNALEAGDSSPDIAVHVLLGCEGAFTAGNDISNFLSFATSDGSGVGEELTDVFRFINLLPRVQKPIIAAVDGIAVGIGTTMLFHCDLVYATGRAIFSTPFLDLGLVPEAASSRIMPERLGYARAFEMLVLGETFSAKRMFDAGLVNAVLEPAELEDTARAAAQRLAKKPRRALAVSRGLMKPNVEEIAALTQIEAKAFAESLKSPEARAAFQSFMKKS